MIFYIADLHFGHENIISFDGRPFHNVAEMNEALIDNWNKKVGDHDTVYILGDLSYHIGSQETEKIARQLKGQKHLILGNHDKKERPWYENVFAEVTPYAEITDVVQGQKRMVVLSHYFIPFYNHNRHQGYMLHGHTHTTMDSAFEEELKDRIRREGLRCEAYNVGCMWQDYAPQTLEEIIARQPRKAVI